MARSKKVKPGAACEASESGADEEAGGPSSAEEAGGASQEKKDEKSKKAKSSKDADDDDDIGPEHGPRSLRERGCTDCCCILLFFVFGLGMAYISYLAWTYGEPYQILYSKDYLGNRCGVAPGFENRTKTVFPRLDQDLIDQAAIATTAPWRVVFYGLCVEACPDVQDPHACLVDPESCIVRDYGTEQQWRLAGGAAYYFQVLPTLDVLNRCVPTRAVSSTSQPDRCAYPVCDNVTMQCDTEIPQLWTIRTYSDRQRCEVKFQDVRVQQFAAMTPSPLTARIADQMAFLSRLVQAFQDATWEMIGFGLGMPVGLGLVWLLILRFFAKTIVYLSIISIGLALGLATLYLFFTSGALDDALDALVGNSTGFTSFLQSLANATGGLIDADAIANATAAATIAVTAAANEANSAIVTLAPDELDEVAASAGTSNSFLYTVAAWVCLIFTVIYLIVMCIARAKIRLAAVLVKESTIVIKDRPQALLFPFFTVALQVPIVLYFLFFFILLATSNLSLSHFVSSAGDLITATSSYVDALGTLGAQAVGGANASIDINVTLPNLTAIAQDLPPDPWWVPAAIFIYFLFGILWILETVKNTGWTALSGNVSDWYFFRRDKQMRSRAPLTRSLCRVLRYHLGSVLFGSFVIALIQLVRIICAIIDKQTQSLQEKNKLLKLTVKCIQCCLWCFEKTVKFITNYCYIYVAMQGSGFCRSCFATFSLILGQPAQLALNTLVRNVLSLIQLIGIPCFCGWLCHHILSANDKPEPIYPSVLVVLSSLVITSAFSTVMSCSLDSLFVCTVRDKTEYKGAFMSDALKSAFGFDKSDRKKRRAEKKAAKESKDKEAANTDA